MSYFHEKIDLELKFEVNTPERRALWNHMRKVVAAIHDVEYVDDARYVIGAENKAILDCVGPIAVLEAHLEMLDEDIQAFKQLTGEEK